jgi:hypothetical protein
MVSNQDSSAPNEANAVEELVMSDSNRSNHKLLLLLLLLLNLLFIQVLTQEPKG